MSDLIEAYRGLGYKARLVVVGDGLPSLKRKLKKAGVLVTGFVDNVEDYLKSADIYVIPSTTETSSLSTLEAMATGLPVISTGAGGMREYLSNNKNALLFDVGDVNLLRKHMEKLLMNPVLRRKLGLNALATAKDYSWDLTIKKLDEIFKEL